MGGMETFVIRLWTDPAEVDESGSSPLKGAAHQVGTGAAIRFHNQEELIDFLTAWSTRAPVGDQSGAAGET